MAKPKKTNKARKSYISEQEGLSITELLVTISIIGILSTLSLPSFVSEVDESRQREAASFATQIQTTIAAYSDEFGETPKSWLDLNEINAVMTKDGPTNEPSFGEISLPDGYYQAWISNTENQFTINVTRPDKPDLDVYACINLNNGASDIKFDSPSTPAENLNC